MWLHFPWVMCWSLFHVGCICVPYPCSPCFCCIFMVVIMVVVMFPCEGWRHGHWVCLHVYMVDYAWLCTLVFTCYQIHVRWLLLSFMRSWFEYLIWSCVDDWTLARMVCIWLSAHVLYVDMWSLCIYALGYSYAWIVGQTCLVKSLYEIWVIMVLLVVIMLMCWLR